MDLRNTARHIFTEALADVALERVLQRKVDCSGTTLRIADVLLDLEHVRNLVVIAMGKAAAPMAEGVLAALRKSDTPHLTVQGVVVGATETVTRDPRLHYLAGSHPFPNGNSRKAADLIFELLSGADATCLVLTLLSGGASSMVEKPLDPTMTDADTEDLHRALVHSGLAIGEMNVLRKHYSAIKGGRLAVAANGATVCTVIVSDVPPDALHVVGSGPSLPDPSTAQQCREILERNGNTLQLSPRLRAYFEHPALPETPKPEHPAFLKAHCVVLLSSDDLCRAAVQSAQRAGFAVEVDNTCDEWEYRDAAQYLLRRAQAARGGDRRCLLSAGEVSVSLPAEHGTGGRNQQFALECARLLANQTTPMTVLSAGSDGIDGNSPAAGAVVDESTARRAASDALPVVETLRRFDGYTLFQRLGDAVMTGPTGNNLRDLRILLTDGDGSVR